MQSITRLKGIRYTSHILQAPISVGFPPCDSSNLCGTKPNTNLKCLSLCFPPFPSKAMSAEIRSGRVIRLSAGAQLTLYCQGHLPCKRSPFMPESPKCLTAQNIDTMRCQVVMCVGYSWCSPLSCIKGCASSAAVSPLFRDLRYKHTEELHFQSQTFSPVPQLHAQVGSAIAFLHRHPGRQILAC